MFCERCGKEIREGAAFCVQCGAAVSSEPAEVPKGKSGKKRWVIPVVLGVIILLFVAVVGGVLLLRVREPEKEIEEIENEADETEDYSDMTDVDTEENELPSEEENDSLTADLEDKEASGSEEDTAQSQPSVQDEPVQEGNTDWVQAYLNKMDEEAQTVNEWNEDQQWSFWEYDLIYLDDDDIPELVSGPDGYWVSVYTYHDGQLYTLIDEWGYGAFGIAGYDYAMRTGIVSVDDADYAGAVVYTYYWKVNEAYELETICAFRSDYYVDYNENGWPDEDEYTEEEQVYYWDPELEDYRQIVPEEMARYRPDLSDAEWGYIEGQYSPEAFREELEKYLR